MEAPRSPQTAASDDVVAELRRAGLRDVDASSRRRAEYSSDASLYRLLPTVVAFPRSPDEVVAALAVGRELGVPITMRGAGTSIAGNAVGSGIVLDVSRHLRQIGPIHTGDSSEPAGAGESVGTATGFVQVQPGAVLDDVQRAAAPFGLRFGPDPSTHSRATIGGMIGNNACGSRALRYGRTADNVLGLDVVTGSGERLTLAAGTGTGTGSSPMLTALAGVVERNLAVIRTELGRFRRQVSGYSLEHLLPERGFDVARALVGSEGSLAVTLGATLRLVRTPPATVLVVLGYPDMATAADAVPALLPLDPVAMEGLDSRIVDVVRRVRGASAVPELPAGQGWLFVELGAETPAELPGLAAALEAAAHALDVRRVTDPSQARELWQIREDGAGLAARPTAAGMALSGWEDAAVPPERLGAYLREFDSLVSHYGLTGYPYGHFGDGCVHVRLDFRLGDAPGRAAFREFLTEAAGLVARHGGSMSGEHGDGRARGELLPHMYSPAALAAFADVKAVFDPAELLNPGIIVRPQPFDADLRLARPRAPITQLAFTYADDGDDFGRAVHRCTGVGKCRADNTSGGGVMCPSYLATRDEKDSTRGRARVLQEMVTGGVKGGWRAPEVAEALDLCLSCKGCSSDCPTGTDMARYKAEALHQRYRHRLRPITHYSLGRLPTWARLASRSPRLVNAVLASPLARVGKRLAGVDARRALPRFAPQTFRQLFADRPTTAQSTGEPIVLWVDTFTDHFSPQVGLAAVRVLEGAGYSVRLAQGERESDQLCCGLTLISTGQLDAARKALRRSVAALRPAIDAGLPVVALEPSCAAVFRDDARHLLEPHEAERAGKVRTLAEILLERGDWVPPQLDGTEIVAQPHCHQHAVMGWAAEETLLARAGASVRRLGGCCGLAGNFGAERGHYDVSVAVAETTLLPAVRSMSPGQTMLADGFSCRTQLDDLAAGWSGGHLAELLDGASTPRR